jgi:hypothetical protein
MNVPQNLPGAQTNDVVIFTACSVNYLGKAVAMCRSAADHNPSVDLVILVVDTKRPVTISDRRIELLWAEDVGFPDYLQCAFKYNIIELNTALKPFVASVLLRTYSKVIFLDPDVCVFGSLGSSILSLDQHSAVFTPIAVTPYVGEGRPNDVDLLRFGSNCLGFFGVNRSPDARMLLLWWHDQCRSKCFYEPQIGLAVDQKWIDLAPSFFDGTHILKDLGLNVAFWNLHERTISRSPAGWMINGDHPLGFVHFSSFSEGDRQVIADKQTRHAAGSRPDFVEAADVYRGYLEASRAVVEVSNVDYGYSKFDNGVAISPTLRRFYALHKDERFGEEPNPFDSNSPVYFFAKKNRLLSHKPAALTHLHFRAAASHSRERRAIAFFFRLLLRILGPDRYFLLLRYLAHYSSIFNQTDLIK